MTDSSLPRREFEQRDVFKVNLIERGLRSALLASQRHEGYLIEENEHGVESLIGYDYTKGHTDFPDLGWFGFVFSNTDMALAAVERLKAVTFAGGLIVALIVIILSLLASRTLTTPLLTITEAVEKVARGDFQTRVALDSKDEFGQLAAAFNTMAEDLQKTTVSKTYFESNHHNRERRVYLHGRRGVHRGMESRGGTRLRMVPAGGRWKTDGADDYPPQYRDAQLKG